VSADVGLEPRGIGAALRGGLGQELGLEAYQGDPGASGREPARGLGADPPGASGDEDPTAGDGVVGRARHRAGR